MLEEIRKEFALIKEENSLMKELKERATMDIEGVQRRML